MHFYESPTGFKFIMLTDPSVGSIIDQMKHIYKNIFVEYVKKNPLFKPGEKVDCYLFTENLEKFLQQWVWFNAN